MEDIHVLAFTHRHIDVNDIGLLHIEVNEQQARLTALKKAFNWTELMFISTCNRVEFIIKTKHVINTNDIEVFLSFLYPTLSHQKLFLFLQNVEHTRGKAAIEHILKVTSSIDSMVVGEREIITQVRKAYEDCKTYGITGDTLRILMKHTIETTKKIYTQTNIARRPVSIVSLAYQTLKTKNVPLNARILFVGAGATNTNMARFLDKHGFTNFAVFNRTKSKAEWLAKHLKGKAFDLKELNNYKEGFDVLISCTGAETHIIDKNLYSHLLQGEKNQKVVIDLAIPSDISPEVKAEFSMDYTAIEDMQKIASKNLKERAKEIIHVEDIIQKAVAEFEQIEKERRVELAMQLVPNQVKAIKKRAYDEVFAKDLENLDDVSKELVDKIVSYFEKKYISMPMKMAKEILLKK